MKYLNLFARKFLICILGISCIGLVLAQSNDLPKHAIHLSFEKIDLRKLLTLMSELGKMNFVLSESIGGHTQVNLSHATWSDSFEAILAQNHLAYLPIGKLLWIAPSDELGAYQSATLKRAQTNTQSQLTHGKSQVMIEARIVEADQRFARNLGIKLGAQSAKDSGKDRASNKYKLSSELSAEGLNGFDPASTSITMLSKGASQLLQIELNALETNGIGNIIANPRIVTADGVKALIEQGTELPYQTSNKEGSKINFRKANLRLEVTPKILPLGQVQMQVEISKDTIGMKTEQGYAIDTKNLKSQISIEDGGTAVIGGIYLHSERNDVVKIPFLGDLPLIGSLFKHQAKLNDKTELLVFITPTLINPASPESINKTKSACNFADKSCAMP
jgi:type IV pilus assembly protein PilQ